MSTLTDMRRRPGLRFVLSHPAHFVAFGFGVGLIPVGPGTWGTLLAFPLYYALAGWMTAPALLACIGGSFLLGVWACEVTGRHLRVHDHSGMVWDEIAAFMLVLFFTPAESLWQGFAFLLFRLFDILKPPPIGRVDRGIANGFGVMLDDVVAAFYALLCLALWQRAYEWFLTV